MLPQTFSDTPVTEVLKVLKKHYDARLAYDVTSLRPILASVRLQGDNLEEDLTELLKGTNYTFTPLKNTYLIVPLRVIKSKGAQVLERSFTVTGKVRDVVSGEPLPFASLSISGSSKGTVTRVDGSYALENIPTDTLQLCASYLGYRSSCASLKNVTEKSLDFYLERNNTFLPAVEIITEIERGIQVMEQGQILAIEPALLERLTVNGQPDLFKAVQFLPGVSSGDGIDAQLNIRGNEDDENLVLWDGFKIYHQNHFFGVFSTLNPNAIRNIQVHKGVYAPRYGGRSGGVLEVTGRTGDRKEDVLEVGLDLIGADISLETPIGSSSSLLVTLRRSHSDFIGTGLFNSLLDRVFEQSTANDPDFDLSLSETDPEFFYYDLNMKSSTELSSKDQLDISFFQGGDTFSNESRNQYEASNGSPRELNDYLTDDTSWGNTGLGIIWNRDMKNGRHAFTSAGFSEYSSSYYFVEEQKDFLNGFPLAEKFSSLLLDNRLRDFSLQHRQLFPVPSGTLEIGYEWNLLSLTYEQITRENADELALFTDSTVQSSNHTLFAERDWMWNNSWALEIGLRSTVNDYTNSLYLEPRALLSYQPRTDFSMRLGGGNFIQTVRRVAEQNLFLRQPDQWVLSDGEALPESRTFQGILGLNMHMGDWTFDLEGFYKCIQGSVLNQEQIRLLSTFTLEQEGLVFGDSEVAGIDALIQYEHQGHDLWIAYSYTASLNRFKEINKGRVFPSTFNKPNDLKVVYAYSYLDYLFSTDFIYSSGYPFTPLLGTFENQLTGQDFVVYGDDLSARLPELFRWDISIQRSFYWSRSKLTLGLGVYNLTNRKNIRSRSYGVDQVRPEGADELTIRTMDLELLGLTPNFILRYTLR